MTSKSKVRFDVAQLKEIIRNSRVENKDWPYLEAAYENMTTVLHSLTTSLLSWKSDDAVRSDLLRFCDILSDNCSHLCPENFCWSN